MKLYKYIFFVSLISFSKNSFLKDFSSKKRQKLQMRFYRDSKYTNKNNLSYFWFSDADTHTNYLHSGFCKLLRRGLMHQ